SPSASRTGSAWCAGTRSSTASAAATSLPTSTWARSARPRARPNRTSPSRTGRSSATPSPARSRRCRKRSSRSRGCACSKAAPTATSPRRRGTPCPPCGRTRRRPSGASERTPACARSARPSTSSLLEEAPHVGHRENSAREVMNPPAPVSIGPKHLPPLGMNDIEQKLLLYDDLPPEEQEEVERYVQVHPEWTALLAEARALRALLRSTHDDDAAPDATDIADYVVARALGKRRPPPEYAARYARVEAALAADPALERQAREMLKTLEQVAAEAEDPMAQFERLTGRRLEARAPAAPTAPAPRVL